MPGSPEGPEQEEEGPLAEGEPHSVNYILHFHQLPGRQPCLHIPDEGADDHQDERLWQQGVLSDAFLKKIRNTDAINNIMSFADQKADKLMAKSDGNKRSRVSNEKLIEANLAGTKRGHECTLVLTEGDSARGLAVAGRAVLDPDRIGVFPLRGKMLNVRDVYRPDIQEQRNREPEEVPRPEAQGSLPGHQESPLRSSDDHGRSGS